MVIGRRFSDGRACARVTMIVSHVHIIVKYQNCDFTSSYLYVFTFVWYDTESAGPCSSSYAPGRHHCNPRGTSAPAREHCCQEPHGSCRRLAIRRKPVLTSPSSGNRATPVESRHLRLRGPGRSPVACQNVRLGQRRHLAGATSSTRMGEAHSNRRKARCTRKGQRYHLWFSFSQVTASRLTRATRRGRGSCWQREKPSSIAVIPIPFGCSTAEQPNRRRTRTGSSSIRAAKRPASPSCKRISPAWCGLPNSPIAASRYAMHSWPGGRSAAAGDNAKRVTGLHGFSTGGAKTAGSLHRFCIEC